MSDTYIPPKQSIAGQLFDVAFLLALVFGALFLPIWLGIAAPSRTEKLPAGVSYKLEKDGKTKDWTGLSWEKLGQNPTMQAQWVKLGYTKESAADIITMPFDYSIDVGGVVITGAVILAYFLFLMKMSEREYRQVIAEKFD
jgi:hypothetical protein